MFCGQTLPYREVMACTTTEAASRVADREEEDSLPSWWSTLTRSERNVAKLVAERLSNGEIGRRLDVSPRTVETHLTHIFRKTPVSNRHELGLAIQYARVARRDDDGTLDDHRNDAAVVNSGVAAATL